VRGGRKVRNIKLQAHKSKNPSVNAGVSTNLVVARGGIDQSLRMANPVFYQLVNLVMIPNINWNDFTLSNDEFKRNPVFNVDRDAM
jgi:hypothetical protein